jgi:hypothetical protein
MPSAKAAEALYRLMIGVEELKLPKYCIMSLSYPASVVQGCDR